MNGFTAFYLLYSNDYKLQEQVKMTKHKFQRLQLSLLL